MKLGNLLNIIISLDLELKGRNEALRRGVKRSMYGRAKIDLLRRKMVLPDVFSTKLTKNL